MSKHERQTGIVPRATASTQILLERRAIPRFYLDERLQTQPWTNVPVTVIQHSPGGFEWGYGGSGPSDLALNILNWFVPTGADGLEPVDCYKGQVSRTAWVLHIDFKAEVIARLGQDQDHTLTGSEVLAWISNHPFCVACSRVHEGAPDGVCVCGHRLRGPCDCHWCVCTRELDALEEEDESEADPDRGGSGLG